MPAKAKAHGWAAWHKWWYIRPLGSDPLGSLCLATQSPFLHFGLGLPTSLLRQGMPAASFDAWRSHPYRMQEQAAARLSSRSPEPLFSVTPLLVARGKNDQAFIDL